MSLPTDRLPGDPIMAEDINDIAAAVNSIPTGTVTPGTNANVLGSGAASLGQVLTADGGSGSAWADPSTASVTDASVSAVLDSELSSAAILGVVEGKPVQRTLAQNVAFFKSTSAAEHTCTIYQAGTSGLGVALNVVSDNAGESAMYLKGSSLDRGVLKITHLGQASPSDADGSAISVDLQGDGSSARGIFMTSTDNTNPAGDWITVRRGAVSGTARDLFAVKGDGKSFFNRPVGGDARAQVDIVGDATTGADPALRVSGDTGHTGPVTVIQAGSGGGHILSFRNAAGSERGRIASDGAYVNYASAFMVDGMTIGGTSNKTGGVAGLGLTEIGADPSSTISGGAVLYVRDSELRVRIGTQNYKVNLTAI